MKPATQAALRTSVVRAARMLEDRLDSPPLIAELARVAGISHFHFQRAFKEIVGESVAQHSQRLRLERAAAFLKFSAWQVQEICLATGFDTPAAFGRAFKKLYGCTPQQFRSRECVVPFLRGYMRSRRVSEAEPITYLTPTVRIEEWPDITVAAIRHYGTVASVIEPWNELLPWIRNHHPDPTRARYFGLWFDDWSAPPSAKPNYRYEAAVSLPDGLEGRLPDPLHLRVIAGGLVARACAKGTMPVLDRAWRAFAHGWLPFSGYQPRGDFAIDGYAAEFVLSSPLKQIIKGLSGLSLDMCIPVQSAPLLP